MQQYKPHPFTLALEALCPLLLPSFTLRSVRDYETTPVVYPLVDYVIISGQGKNYENSKNKFRSLYLVQIDILFEESSPNCWAEYEELSAAKERQALYYRLEEIFEQLIVLLVNPSAISPVLKGNDMIYSKYDFRLDSYLQTVYHNKKGADNLTGASARFILSAQSDGGVGCCLLEDGASVDILEAFQKLTLTDSVSYKLIQNLIDGA